MHKEDHHHNPPSGFLSTNNFESGTSKSSSSPRTSLFSRQLRNSTTTSSSQSTATKATTSAGVTSPMALFMSFQAALVASGFDERLWSLIKESELLAGALFPYGLFLRHTLQAFPSATLEAMNGVEGFVVEGTDEKLVPQIYKALETLFGFKPTISSAQFLKAFNPCGKSKFAGHLIQTCASFHALMKRKETQIIKDVREKQQQHQMQLLRQHQSTLQIADSTSQRQHHANSTTNNQLAITMMPFDEKKDRDAQKFEAELSIAREELFAVNNDNNTEAHHHHQPTPPYRTGQAELLDRSEVGGGYAALSSVNSSLVDMTNRSVRIGTTAGIPIKIGGKLEMRCVSDNSNNDTTATHSNTSSSSPKPMAIIHNNQKVSSSGAVVLAGGQQQSHNNGGVVVRRPDRFGQYAGGDISTAPSTHFSCMSSKIYSRHGGGAANDVGVAPPSSTTNCCPEGEVLDAMVSCANNSQYAANQHAASTDAMGCCARHALHSIRHHDRNIDKSRLELSKLELQHSALNSQKRTALNREVGGFRL